MGKLGCKGENRSEDSVVLIIDLFEGLRSKAGICPYALKDDVLYVRLMIPSDPDYGGTSWQIAKGRVDAGESVEQSAVREGVEELGLRPSNIRNFELLSSKQMSGYTSSYMMYIYIAEVIDTAAFDKPHYETGKTEWVDVDTAISSGRSSHVEFFTAIKSKLQAA